MIKRALLAAAGGAVGAAGRYLSGALLIRLLGPGYPWGTLFVNITGSLLMGILIGLFALRLSASQETQIFLTTGMLGGFTTFSTFALDVAVMVERKAPFQAAGYLLLSVSLSILALFAGLMLMRLWLAPH